ncbi:integrative conjugative element protein, RAQPRD family [Chitinimonas lacunae]|uniref:RAQPRD family integrative conjugative element protein n=1 Tax=Chitinimonas lacunae TaxID=1963018 RepID=A0ABV8MRL2_9NEIS
MDAQRHAGAVTRGPAVLVVLLSCLCGPVAVADTPEHQHLAALIRQLELAERLTAHAAASASQAPARYHFDYTRLRADLQRVHAGIHDYLVPYRAQPRDPVPLIGDYTREAPREAAR